MIIERQKTTPNTAVKEGTSEKSELYVLLALLITEHNLVYNVYVENFSPTLKTIG